MSLTTNLDHYWTLNESSGNSSDSVGSATLTDHGSCGTTTGVLTNARSFNGSTQWLEAATGLLGGLTDFTLSFWIKFTSGGGVLGQADPGGNNSFLEPSRLKIVGVSGNQDGSFTSLDSFGAGWHYLTIRRGSSGWTLWRDGASFSSVSSAGGVVTTPTTYGLSLGRSPVGTGGATGWVTGAMCECGLWSRQISDTEVGQIYNGGAGLAFSSFGGGAPAFVAARPRTILQAINRASTY